MFCQNTGNINPRFIFDIETAKSVILLCMFLSCRIGVYCESALCNCLNNKNPVLEPGTISKI